MYSTIKAAIKTKIESITDVKYVYGYEKGDLNGYPAAVVLLESITADYETNQEDSRKYTFKVKVYQEMSDDGVGAEEAESRLEALIDTILDGFEDDWTLSDNCYKVNISGISGWAERGADDEGVRVYLGLLCHLFIKLNLCLKSKIRP